MSRHSRRVGHSHKLRQGSEIEFTEYGQIKRVSLQRSLKPKASAAAKKGSQCRSQFLQIDPSITFIETQRSQSSTVIYGSDVIIRLSKYAHVSLNPAGAQIITNLIQIIYVSQPFGFDEPTLAGILLDARRCNKRDGVTGALVCRHDIYLQLLEGPEVPVRAAYERISQDDRHVGVKQLLNGEIQGRLFANWAMLHDPAKTWIWTEQEIANAALDRAEPQEIMKVFKDLADRAGMSVKN